MGNNSYQQSLNFHSEPLQHLSVRFSCLHIDSQRSISIWQNKQTKQIRLVKEAVFKDKEEFQNKRIKYNAIREISQNSQNVLQLEKIWTEEQNKLCSDTYKIYSMYEFESLTLQDQIKARKEENKSFQEEELLGLLQACLNALKTHNLVYFNPSNIYVCQGGLLKAINQELFDPNIELVYQEQVYYTPEKMFNFTSDLTEQGQRQYRGFIFSMGMTVLECIFLQKFYDLYDAQNLRPKMRFNTKKLERLKERVINYTPYSRELKKLIVDLLNVQIGQQPSLQEIQRMIDQVATEGLFLSNQQNCQQSEITRTVINPNKPSIKGEKMDQFSVSAENHLSSNFQHEKEMLDRKQAKLEEWGSAIKSPSIFTEEKFVTTNQRAEQQSQSSEFSILKEINLVGKTVKVGDTIQKIQKQQQNFRKTIVSDPQRQTFFSKQQISHKNCQNQQVMESFPSSKFASRVKVQMRKKEKKDKQNIPLKDTSQTSQKQKQNMPQKDNEFPAIKKSERNIISSRTLFNPRQFGRLPDPVDSSNPLLTNPEFLRKIDENIQNFGEELISVRSLSRVSSVYVFERKI